MDLKKKITLAAVLIGMTALAGCGGSSTTATAPPTQTVAGVVADGYLTGAIVCLDTDNDKSCDGEIYRTTSLAGGAYSIPNVTAAALAQYPIVVEVPVGATDSERGDVTSAYFMSAPAGKPEFVSPLTTLVQNQIETNGLSVDQAVASVKTQLGLTTLSPLDDYQPGVSGASSESVVAAGVAKVIATTIATNKAAIEGVVGSSTTVTVQQVVNLIVQQVMQNLGPIVSQVNESTDSGSIPMTETSVSTVTDATNPQLSEETLIQDLAVASTSSNVSSDLIAAATAGMYTLEQWQDGWDQINNEQLYSYFYGKTLFSASTNIISFSDYMLGNGAWVADTQNSEVYLTSTGWKVETVTNSGNIDPATGIYSSPSGYDKQQARVVKIDVSGQAIVPYLKSSFQSAPSISGNFPAGSLAYRLTFIPVENIYVLYTGDDGNYCSNYDNTARVCTAGFASLDEMLSNYITYNNYIGYGDGSFKFLAENKIQITPNDGVVTTSTYKRVTVSGVDMIIADLTPCNGGFKIAAVYDGRVYGGEYKPANLAQTENSFDFNKTSMDAILAAVGLPTAP